MHNIKGSVQQEDITFVNICAPNMGPLKYINQIVTEIKGEIDSNTIIVEDLIPHLISMDRSSRQKINKETLTLKDTLYQID